MHHGDQKAVVNKTAQTEAGIALQPRGEIAKGHHKTNRGTVVFPIHVLAEGKQNQTRRGQGQTDQPSKALGLGGFPERLGVKHKRNERRQSPQRRHGRQTNQGARNELKAHQGVEHLDKDGLSPKENVDESDPRDDVQEAGTDANGMLVHEHVLGFVGVGVVTEFPPFAVLAANDEAVHERHGFCLGRATVWSNFVDTAAAVDRRPWKVLGLGVGFNGVARIGNDGRRRAIQVVVLENHERGDGGKLEHVAHGLGALQAVGHDIDAGLLADARLEGLGVAIVADKKDLAALFHFQNLGAFDNFGSERTAAREGKVHAMTDTKSQPSFSFHRTAKAFLDLTKKI